MIQEYGVKNAFQIPFLSIIDSKKTYSKATISRLYPDLKQFY